MRRALLVMVMVVAFAAASQAGTYSWAHGDDLQTDGSITWQDGWAVVLYNSATDAALPTQIFGDLTTGGAFSQGVSTVIAGSGEKSGQIYSSSFDVPSDVSGGDFIITVAFNSTLGAITPGSTQWTTFDSGGTPVVESTAPGFYTTTGFGNGWTTVVPEPSTWALFGMGMITLGVLRRKRTGN